MNPADEVVPVVAGPEGPLSIHKRYSVFYILLALLLTLCLARADSGPDEDYLAIYRMMGQADALAASGKTNRAYTNYVAAEQSLTQFQHDNPGWNVNLVTFRLKYLDEKIAATSGAPVAPATTTTPAPDATTSPDNTSTAAPGMTADAGAEATPAAKSVVTLLDPGSEPRAALRLHPTAGDKQTMAMTMKMAMSMTMAGNQVPAMNVPAMQITMDVTVKDISADGDITYNTVFTDATVAADTNTAPAMAAAMKTTLAGLTGMTGTGTMTDHGIIKDMEMTVPPDASPQLSQMMEQMKGSMRSSSSPLPQEPVGAGAKWEYKSQVKSQGMTIDQTTTSELVSADGDHLTLRTTIAQNAANQQIESPSMPGMKVDLTKMTGTGGGDATFDLGHIMPIAATLAENIQIAMAINTGQQKQPMNMSMTMNITLASK
jgi:hypothetical protein